MFIALLWLFFGATICLGIPDHSSDAIQQEVTDAGSEDLPDLDIKQVKNGEFENEGDLSVRTTRSPCKRHSFRVDLGKMYGENIIRPRSYEAYRCMGECTDPIPTHMKPTNHALIQKQMNGIDKKWPSPCCVPTKLSSIQVLYHGPDKKIHRQRFEEMVVEECGCR